MTEKSICYIGIGANLSNPIAQVKQAIESLKLIDKTQVLDSSHLYQTTPMGPQDQPDYINAVTKIETKLTPLELLDALQSIENKQGRVRKAERWGPRVIDLDILAYGNITIKTDRLIVPHYGIRERNFVLLPLQDISPDFSLPNGETLSELLLNIDQKGIMKLE